MYKVFLSVVILLCVSVVNGQPEPQSPDFTITPDKIVEEAGGTATISCVYKPSPTTDISWGVEKSGNFHVIFPNNSTAGIKTSLDSRTLIFDSIDRSQEGNYYCYIGVSSAENLYSDKIVPLTVFFRPVIRNKDKPNGQVRFDYNLTVRMPARLNFTTIGSPTPALDLYKRSSGNNYEEYVSPRFTITLSGLLISSVEPEDEGDYRLIASYEVVQDSEEFSISVHIPPVAPKLALEVIDGKSADANVTRVLATIGSQVVIACQMTEAYTVNLQVYWAHDTRILVDGSSPRAILSIDDVTLENSGQYSCHASNPEGTALRSIELVVGSVPSRFIITVTSNNDALTVIWEKDTSSTKPYDDNITAHYIQYRLLNDTRAQPVIQKIASSVQTVTFRNVNRGNLYGVQMWSENEFGNSTESDEHTVIVVGDDPPTGEPVSTSKSNDSNGAVIGAVIGVCLLFVVIFCAITIVLIVIYYHNMRTRGQQQWQKDPEFQSQLSLSTQSMRMPPPAPSETMIPPPVPTYAVPFVNNGLYGLSSSSISKRSSEENNWQIPRDCIQLSELLAEGEHIALYRATVFGIRKFKKATEVTVKQVIDSNSSPEEVKVLIEEMDLMQDLGIHPNVVNVLAVCTVGDPVYLIMDYFAHGDLLGFLRATRGHTDHYTVSAGTETKVPSFTVQPQDLLSLACQIANGMSFLEEKKVPHRSLCARNVMVGTGLQVKIYNYGQKNDDQSSYAKWMAPETLFDGTANTTSDAWSFGVTLWEIVTIGGSPYFQMRPEDMRKVLEDGYRMPNPDHCSEEIYKVMQDCWEYDPQDRPSFDLINYRLETLSKSKLSYIDLKLYDEVLYSQFEDTPQLCTAL